MSEEKIAPKGTLKDPVIVWQHHWSGCGHTKRYPELTKGQYYRVAGFLDSRGAYPECKEMRANTEKAAKLATKEGETA